MAKRLSEQLADLSVRTKRAEDAVSAAEKEAHDKIAARKEQAHADAAAAVEKVDNRMRSAGDRATKDWGALRAKVASDMTALKTRVAHAKHEHDVKHKQRHADDLEWEAELAIDYAVSSIEQARLAVLDAVDARLAADDAAG